MSNEVGQVLTSSASSILIEVSDPAAFEAHKESLQVGRYLKIAEGNRDFILAVIRNVSATKAQSDEGIRWSFSVECVPVGRMLENGTFEKGTTLLPVPTEPAYSLTDDELRGFFVHNRALDFQLGVLSQNPAVPFMVEGNKFFAKHVAVLGSTGSGKSCAVATILHEAVGIGGGANRNAGSVKNAHVVIFDLHSEYGEAFRLTPEQGFSVSSLDAATMALPYWLMNSDELESIFIETGEHNHHNQVSQFRRAVLLNKERHHPGVAGITYDTPVYFSIREVLNYIDNVNREVIGRKPGEGKPKLSDLSLVDSREKTYFSGPKEFVEASTATERKATNGPFHGEFNKFLSRLETKVGDARLAFLLDPRKADGSEYLSVDFEALLRRLVGYLGTSNVTIIDLSGVPFEVLSVTVSLVARLLFDFAFHYSKAGAAGGGTNDAPFLLVCEEAHNYVPANDSASYRASRQSIERIAKEGRKYGLSLMVVSQRPSEVSPTILAQCSNFVALRLTNADDQAYVRHLLPDTSSGVTDVLSVLRPGECVVVGDAVLLPAVVRLSRPIPEPRSRPSDVLTEWRLPWKDINFSPVISRWRRE